MKKIIAVALCLILCMSCMSCGQQQQSSSGNNSAQLGDASTNQEVITIRFNIPETTPDTPNYWMMQEFIEGVESKSNGHLKINYIAAGSLGSETDLTDAVMTNTVDIATIPDMSIDTVIDCMGFAFFPCLFSSNEEARENYHNGWISDELTARMAEHGLYRFGDYSCSFMWIGNTKREVTDLQGLSGLKIRVSQLPYLVSFFEKIGMLPASLSGSEQVQAIQQGTIDGTATGSYFLAVTYNDILPYMVRTNHLYSGGSFVASEQFWNSLSDEDKQILTDVATEVGNRQIDRMEEAIENFVEGCSNGTYSNVITQMDEKSYQQMKTIAVSVWEQYKDKYGADIVDTLIADFGT